MPTTSTVLTSVVALVALAAVGGCSGEDDPGLQPGAPSDQAAEAAEAADELAAHDGELCPDELPVAEGGSGLVDDQGPAPAAPTPATPEAGAVCRYEPTLAADSGGGGSSQLVQWSLDGDAVQVPAAGLGELEPLLADLSPLSSSAACGGELGTRWMLVTVAGGDLTGVVVDDFGCRPTRMTDEPFETVPGEASQPGTVPGLLEAPDDLLPSLRRLSSTG